ncbi:MAG: undecaprenyl/decaprenyl-phosphate alpha-N-acetylglucosaminyl 1-phosphate transferase [Phycisphaerales bacterium]|nr:undecaprenyl/decaprenyl-phosphate alpha-N-acetylglucosaminyl 1-phosphate transferase [Phycisphaerales bacterium]
MLLLCLLLIPIAFALAVPATWLARAIGRRLNALDSAGVAGQIKAAPRKVPNTGGVGIFLAFAGPMLAGLLAIKLGAVGAIADALPAMSEHLPGLEKQAGAGLVLIACVAALHVLGLIDDRRALPAVPKLFVMLGVSAAAVWATDSRLLTFLDAHAGGAWLSIVITVLYLGVVTNAFNFLDNMDGLSAGVAAVCCSFFLTVALMSPAPQWFVAGALALLLGALLGFLSFNFPFRARRKLVDGTSAGGASVFMGDGGSLVVGFLLAVLSVRITYVQGAGAPWYGAMIPLVILAVPLYDLVSVSAIRIAQGRSPLVGDLQHFSHRLVGHGLSPRAAVVVIYACTAITGIGAVSLPRLEAWQAALVGVQTLLVLLTIAIYEYKRGPATPPGVGGGR